MVIAVQGIFSAGVPEDLILTDAFEATFSHADVHFDKASGVFSRNSLGRESIALFGEGIPAMWTYRALERAGYQVVEPGKAPRSVEVFNDGGTLSWKIHEQEMILCKSVEGLLRYLNADRSERVQNPSCEVRTVCS